MHRGFTLIQVSILLLVASLVLVAVLPSARTTLNANSATTAKLNSILTAIRGYEAAHAALPCPADASQPIGSTTYGVAAANSGTGSPGNCAGGSPASNYVDTANNVAVGMVPVRTLGLSNDYALDSFGRDITYAVDTNATVCFSGTLPGKITVTDNGTANNTIAALISHGADGHGAWIPLTGSSGTAVRLNSGSTDANELLNAHVNSGFTPTAPLTNFAKTMPTATFDDLLVYRSNLWTLNAAPASTASLLPSIILPSNGTYYTGQTLTFLVTYGNTVTVAGTPQLQLSVPQASGSAATHYANYVSSSGNTATFSYTVQSTDYVPTSPGNLALVSPINLNGGSITVGGGAACLSFTPPSLTGILLNPVTIYVQDGGNYRVQAFSPSGTYLFQWGSEGGGNGQFGTNGSDSPQNAGEITIDSGGNVWVADYNNGRVEEFNSTGTYKSQFGNGFGTGPLYFKTVIALAINGSGNLLAGGDYNDRVQTITPGGAFVSQFPCASGACAQSTANGQFIYNNGGSPTGVAVAANGNIWTADWANNRIQEFNSSGTWLQSIGGPSSCETSPNSSAPACSAGTANVQFNGPWGIAIDGGGNIWVADNCYLREFSSSGGFILQTGGCGTGAGQFVYPAGIAVDPSGNIWVPASGDYVSEFSNCGTYLGRFGSAGSGSGQINSPGGVAIYPNTPGGGGGCITSVSAPSSGAYSTGQVLTFTVTYNAAVTVTGTPQLVLTMGSNTRYANYVSGSGGTTLSFSYTIQSSDTTSGIALASSISLNGGTITTTNNGVAANGSFTAPSMGGIVINSTTYMLVADTGNSRIQKFDFTSNDYVLQFGTSGAGNGQFNTPYGSAVDSGGNIWVADKTNNRIEEFSSSGVYESQFGSVGSGNGQLDHPEGIAIDGSGNIWVGDQINNRIEEFSSAGAYESQFGSSGSGNGQFNGPQHVHIDFNGNILVTDWGNCRMQQFNSSGVWKLTIGPTITNYGTMTCGSGYNTAGGSVDACGDVWFGDNSGSTPKVVETDYEGNYVSSFSAGTSSYNLAEVQLDANGNVYVLSSANDLVSIYNSTGTLQSSFGSAGAGNGQFTSPYGLTVVGSAPSALPRSSCSPVILSVAGPSAGNYAAGGTLGFGVTYDQAVTVTGTPEIAITIDGVTHQATYVSGSGTTTLTFQYTVAASDIGGVSAASTITLNGGTIQNSGGLNAYVNFTAPSFPGVTVNLIGSYFFTDVGNCVIRAVNIASGNISTIAGNHTCGYNGDGGAATSAELNNQLTGIALDSSGNVYISDRSNYRIREVNMATGIITTVAGNGTQGYTGDGGAATSAEIFAQSVAVDSTGNIYLTDLLDSVVRKVTASTGKISTVAGNGTAGFSGDGGLATSAKISGPNGVAVDSSGNIYFNDGNNYRIREVSAATGDISTIAGNGTAGYTGDGGAATSAEIQPYGIGVDSSGNVYISDVGHCVVRKVTASTGKISTVGGNGTCGYSGDGGLATSAKLDAPRDNNEDASGNIYIPDSGSNRIREVTVSNGHVNTIAGNGTAGYSGNGAAATSAEVNTPWYIVVGR